MHLCHTELIGHRTAWEEEPPEMCTTRLLRDTHSTSSVLTAGSLGSVLLLGYPLDMPFAGAIVASSNAALALVQLGDEPAAIKEMQKASRRAPGSVDLRAALAGLYWAQVSCLYLPTAADTLSM